MTKDYAQRFGTDTALEVYTPSSFVAGTDYGTGIFLNITQSSHGFSVGDVLKFASGAYAKAKADVAANAEVVGIVSAVADSGHFTLLMSGYLSGLSGLTQNSQYYLSAATAGAYTSTEPTAVNNISKPIFQAISTTEAIVNIMRGIEQ